MHSSFDISKEDLAPACIILASDEDKTPLAWYKNAGDANIVYWNTVLLARREMRGFFLQTLLLTMNTPVVAVENFAVFQIDDFPPSLSDAPPPQIDREFTNVSWNEFIFDIWYDDMMSLKDMYALKYTWYAVMNYHDADVNQLEQRTPNEREIDKRILNARLERIKPIKGDDEIALHGYNHVPLIEESWPNIQTLKMKLLYARELWEENFPEYMPRSWVPANNQYHSEHVSMVKTVFPEIDVVCSNYSAGSFADGMFRDFGLEPWDTSLYCLPRETYGYVMKPELKLMMLSQIGSLGLWTHFIHPDDIFDIPSDTTRESYNRNIDRLYWRRENDKGAPGMFTQLEQWIGFVRKTFPWIKIVTTSEAHKQLIRHYKKNIKIELSRSKISIDCDEDSGYFIRTQKNQTIHAHKNCSILGQANLFKGRLYFIKCGKGPSTVKII